jgi:hypothetical protein
MPSSAGVLPGSIRIVTDETATDAALGMELGMPRDLNGDGDAADTDVSGHALHPAGDPGHPMAERAGSAAGDPRLLHHGVLACW